MRRTREGTSTVEAKPTHRRTGMMTGPTKSRRPGSSNRRQSRTPTVSSASIILHPPLIALRSCAADARASEGAARLAGTHRPKGTSGRRWSRARLAARPRPRPCICLRLCHARTTRVPLPTFRSHTSKCIRRGCPHRHRRGGLTIRIPGKVGCGRTSPVPAV